MAEKKQILTSEAAEKKMQRMALEIAGQLYGEDEPLVIVGIAGSGMVIAEKMMANLKPLLSNKLTLLSCKLNKRQPEEISYSEQHDFTDKNILLIDDVTNSGRTLLYALKPLLVFHPKRIQTLALVERMHKNFPIKIDYTGLSIATTLSDHIEVEVEDGVVMGAYLT